MWRERELIRPVLQSWTKKLKESHCIIVAERTGGRGHTGSFVGHQLRNSTERLRADEVSAMIVRLASEWRIESVAIGTGVTQTAVGVMKKWRGGRASIGRREKQDMWQNRQGIVAAVQINHHQRTGTDTIGAAGTSCGLV